MQWLGFDRGFGFNIVINAWTEEARKASTEARRASKEALRASEEAYDETPGSSRLANASATEASSVARRIVESESNGQNPAQRHGRIARLHEDAILDHQMEVDVAGAAEQEDPSIVDHARRNGRPTASEKHQAAADAHTRAQQAHTAAQTAHGDS